MLYMRQEFRFAFNLDFVWTLLCELTVAEYFAEAKQAKIKMKLKLFIFSYSVYIITF